MPLALMDKALAAMKSGVVARKGETADAAPPGERAVAARCGISAGWVRDGCVNNHATVRGYRAAWMRHAAAPAATALLPATRYPLCLSRPHRRAPGLKECNMPGRSAGARLLRRCLCGQRGRQHHRGAVQCVAQCQLVEQKAICRCVVGQKQRPQQPAGMVCPGLRAAAPAPAHAPPGAGAPAWAPPPGPAAARPGPPARAVAGAGGATARSAGVEANGSRVDGGCVAATSPARHRPRGSTGRTGRCAGR